MDRRDCEKQFRESDTVTSRADHIANHWLWTLMPWCMLAIMATLLLFNHAVMSYSDPNHWVYRAIKLAEGEPQARRVLLFPLYLIGALRLVGPDWIFLANLPWILLLALSIGLLAALCLPETARRAERHTVAALGILLFTIFTYSTLIRCLNPYREAGAFALVIGGTLLFVKSDRKSSWGLALIAGLLLTLSMGFRETTALCLLPPAIWTLMRFARTPRKRLAWCGGLLAGGILGLSPFFAQNFLYSGNPLIPGYSARLIVQQEPQKDGTPKRHIEASLQNANPKKLTLSLNRLVPGMELDNFSKTAPKAWRKLNGRVGRIGVLLAGLGIAVALCQRQPVLLGLLLPSLLINYIFYCFYFYVKWRYFFVVDIYVALFAAYALYNLAALTANGAKAIRSGWACLVFPVLMASLLTGAAIWSSHMLTDQNRELKVWNIGTFRAQIKPLLQEPWWFVGRTHHREMLSWILGQNFRHSALGNELSRHCFKDKNMNDVLHAKGTCILQKLNTKNVYLYDKGYCPRLFSLCTSLEPIVDLETITPTLYHYGRGMDKTLYHIRRWQEPQSSATLDIPDPRVPAVLLVNVAYPWIYENRTSLTLWANGKPWLPHVENGAQFHELPTTLYSQPQLSLELRSDAPVSPSLPVRLWQQNQPLDLVCGFHRNWWWHHLVSPNMYHIGALRNDAWTLWDRGDMTFPLFADTNRNVYVDLTMELYQEDPLVRNNPAFLTANTAAGQEQIQFPGPRQMANVTFSLGAGTGHLTWKTLTLNTTLKSHPEQVLLRHDKTAGRTDWHFAKIVHTRIFTLPKTASLPWRLDLGAHYAGAYIVRGTHYSEQHLGRYGFRWTTGEAVMHLPHMQFNHAVLIIRFFPPPVSARTTAPYVRWNDERCDLLNVDPDGHAWVEARYAIPDRSAVRNTSNHVEILSKSWCPHTEHGTADQRKLGIMLHQIEIKKR